VQGWYQEEVDSEADWHQDKFQRGTLTLDVKQVPSVFACSFVLRAFSNFKSYFLCENGIDGLNVLSAMLLGPLC